MKKRISIPVETEFHAAVKILAIRRGISLTALIQNLLKKELTQ